MHQSLQRWGRAWLGLLIASAAFAAFLSTPAHAGFESPAAITVDSDMNWWSMANVASNGAYQWTAYWDAAEVRGRVFAQVSRRRISDGRVDTIRFDGTGGTSSQSLRNLNDAHDYLQLGLSDADGRLHISWSHHGGLHHYARSAERCLTEATFTQESCRFDWSRFQTEQRDTEDGGRSIEAERSFTYPYYFNDSRGRLYISYRFGGSPRGNRYINSYDEATGRWTSRGRVLWGRIGSGSIEWDVPDDGDPETPDPATSEMRGAYPWGWQFDKNDRLHVIWVWREALSALVGQDYQHGLYYAYSDDYGRTWYGSAGTRLGTSGSEPITGSTAGTQVLEMPPGTYPLGADIELDSYNRPHVVAGVHDGEPVADPSDADLRLRHVWQGTNGSWYSSWVNSPAQTQPWGELMFDGADSAYFIYGRNNLDWVPYYSSPWSQTQITDDLVTWQADEARAGHLNVRAKTAITCLDTTNRIETAIEASGNSQLRVRVQNRTDATQLEVWFTTDAERTWDNVERRRVETIVANEGSYRDVTFDFSRTADWRGTLRQLEICMLDPRAEAGDEFNVDWARVTNAEGRAAKSWEFDTVGAQLYLAEVASTNNWGEAWTDAALLPEVSDVRTDNAFILDPERYKETGLLTFPMLQQGAPGTEAMVLREFRVTGDTIRKQWRFDLDGMEWTAANHVERLGWASDGGVGTLEGRITGEDSAVDSPANLGVKLGGRTVEVRMKQSAGTQAMLCWTTNASRTWNINRCSRTFEVRADGRQNTYRVSTERWRDWTRENTLYQLRLEPSDTREVRSGTFNVDSIKLVD